MSVHQMFRRVAVPPQMAQQMQIVTIPAPVRGLVLSENEAYMQPGGALVMDNWKPTLRGSALRGGCDRWCELPETDASDVSVQICSAASLTRCSRPTRPRSTT